MDLGFVFGLALRSALGRARRNTVRVCIEAWTSAELSKLRMKVLAAARVERLFARVPCLGVAVCIIPCSL